MIEDCPNCITPWKCNGPHLEKITENNYKCGEGYFLFENSVWVFLPFEKNFDKESLLCIIDILSFLNERKS